VNENDINEIRRYVRSSVIDKIIFKDILKLSGIRDIDLLTIILELIASTPGMYLEYNSLAQQLGRDRRLIKEYIMLLKEGFIIKILGNYRKGKIASLRKMKRVYISDNGIITAYKPITDDTFFGKMVENAVINFLNPEFFWKNSREVDAVLDGIPVEIKYKPKIISSDLLGLREFMKKFGKKKGILLTRNDEKTIKVKEGVIDCVPAWKFLLD